MLIKIVIVLHSCKFIKSFFEKKTRNRFFFSAFNSEVKSIEIKETKDEDGKSLYSLSQRKFESILDLVSYYRTYDFAEVIDGSSKTVLYRLGKPLPRDTWRQELERQSWYQPNLTRQQAEELLLGVSLNKTIKNFD